MNINDVTILILGVSASVCIVAVSFQIVRLLEVVISNVKDLKYSINSLNKILDNFSRDQEQISLTVNKLNSMVEKAEAGVNLVTKKVVKPLTQFLTFFSFIVNITKGLSKKFSKSGEK